MSGGGVPPVPFPAGGPGMSGGGVPPVPFPAGGGWTRPSVPNP